MRIWDIVDKIHPGVEITSRNEHPAKIATTRGTKFFALAAGILLATTSAFCMPVPREGFVTSAQHARGIVKTPPLEKFFAGEGFSAQEEAQLLSKLDSISFTGWSPSRDDVQRAINANLSEDPSKNVPVRPAKLSKRRKLA